MNVHVYVYTCVSCLICMQTFNILLLGYAHWRSLFVMKTFGDLPSANLFHGQTIHNDVDDVTDKAATTNTKERTRQHHTCKHITYISPTARIHIITHNPTVDDAKSHHTRSIDNTMAADHVYAYKRIHPHSFKATRPMWLSIFIACRNTMSACVRACICERVCERVHVWTCAWWLCACEVRVCANESVDVNDVWVRECAKGTCVCVCVRVGERVRVRVSSTPLSQAGAFFCVFELVYICCIWYIIPYIH